MNYVTVAMIAKHAKKAKSSVVRALKNAGTKTETFPGVHGLRIDERDANMLLKRQWPECGPMPQIIQTYIKPQ
jgi:hypothetical protein